MAALYSPTNGQQKCLTDAGPLSRRLQPGFPFSGSARTRRAFTLVEMLVSVAVLALLVAIVAQMVNSATNLTGLNQQHLEVDNQARAVFERMGRDFEGMIRRRDVDCSIYPYGYSFKSTPGATGSNDCLYFFSSANAISAGDSHAYLGGSIGVVGYRIWENLSAPSLSQTPYFALDRLGAPTALRVPFDRGMLFLCTGSAYLSSGSSYQDNSAYVDKSSTLLFGTYPTASHLSDTNYHCLGDEVFRLEFGLLMADGTYFREAPNSQTQTITDMGQVRAIVVTIALLDNASRLKIPGYTSTNHPSAYDNDMVALIGALKKSGNPSVADDWTATIAKLGSDNSVAPGLSNIARRVALANVRVYQRFFWLR